MSLRLVFYTHSLVSDWNHGNAHFLRGVMRELVRLGHRAEALEPEDGWSRRNLVASEGGDALAQFGRDFPSLRSTGYAPGFDHARALEGADAVIVHEWTDPDLVARLGRLRRRGAPFRLLFHDTHHRAVSASGEIAGLDLDGYDAILAFGAALRDLYRRRGWERPIHVWHEAADTALFRPLPWIEPEADLVWIGNWGDGERSAELGRFLVEPVRRLGCTGTVHGVRYPFDALERLAGAGLAYRGWLANARVPEVFARHRLTLHVPRRPYVKALPGIPTIRVFEALACGIPLVCAPWDDRERLFRPGRDFLVARDGAQMEAHIRTLLADPERRAAQAASGLETIRARHTCRHRALELLGHLEGLAERAKEAAR